MTEEQICVLCGFDIGNSKKQGRQWGQSFEFNGHWICGECAQELREILNER